MSYYKETLLAMADSLPLQMRDEEGNWTKVSDNQVLSSMQHGIHRNRLRVADKTITIGDYTFNAPEGKIPEGTAKVWVPSLANGGIANCVFPVGGVYKWFLEPNTVFLRECDAQAATKAFIQLLKGKP